MDGIKFQCDICGSCCRNLGKMVISAMSTIDSWKEGDPPLPDVIYDLAEFPYLFDEKGVCEKLNPSGFCNVYAERPVICNTELMYERYYKGVISREDWYKASKITCMKLQRKVGYHNGQHIVYNAGNK